MSLKKKKHFHFQCNFYPSLGTLYKYLKEIVFLLNTINLYTHCIIRAALICFWLNSNVKWFRNYFFLRKTYYILFYIYSFSVWYEFKSRTRLITRTRLFNDLDIDSSFLQFLSFFVKFNIMLHIHNISSMNFFFENNFCFLGNGKLWKFMQVYYYNILFNYLKIMCPHLTKFAEPNLSQS